MITFQVKIIDGLWGFFAKVVTDRENHKTEARYQSSLVFKTKRIVTTRMKIRAEMKKPGIYANGYTYLQLQAKCDGFCSSDTPPDYMELTVQFAMVTCFSVVLAYRQLYVLQ